MGYFIAKVTSTTFDTLGAYFLSDKIMIVIVFKMALFIGSQRSHNGYIQY